MKTVGVLALQGDFEAHERALERAGARSVRVKKLEDFDRIDALVIPGGESTTMLKLLNRENLFGALQEFADRKPVLGTCAGAILLARDVSHPQQASLDRMDIGVERNAYGRQVDSRVVPIEPEPEFLERMGGGRIEAVFIRAPIIRRVGPQGKILASYNGDPVLVEEGRHVAATFHPELTGDTRVHRLLIAKL